MNIHFRINDVHHGDCRISIFKYTNGTTKVIITGIPKKLPNGVGEDEYMEGARNAAMRAYFPDMELRNVEFEFADGFAAEEGIGRTA